MLFSDTEWKKITNYLKLQIREYCAKNSIDLLDFSKRLGITYRVLSRLYSFKSAGERNNKFLSSLEFLYSLANALEIDINKMIYEINSQTDIYAANQKHKEKNTSKITDRIKLVKLLNSEIVEIFNQSSNRKERRIHLAKYINISVILMYVNKSTLDKIISLIENDTFNETPKKNKDVFIKFLNSIKND